MNSHLLCATTPDTQLESISQNLFSRYILKDQLRPCLVHEVLLEQTSWWSSSLNSNSLQILITLSFDSLASFLLNHKDLYWISLFSNHLNLTAPCLMKYFPPSIAMISDFRLPTQLYCWQRFFFPWITVRVPRRRRILLGKVAGRL